MRKTKNQIRQLFKTLQTKSGHGDFYAWLGRGDGTVIANDNNGVYIIDYDGNVQVVLNTKVPLYPFRLVEVGYISETSKVLEVKRLVDAYPDNRPPAIQNHSKTQEWGGADTLWVRPEQIMVGLCLPDDTDLLKVHFVGFVYYLNGFHLLDNFAMDMTSEVPSAGAAWVLLQVDETRTVTAVTGTSKDNWRLLEYEDIPEPDAGNIPLVAIRLYYGQTRIWKNKTRSDIIDLRWSGYSSGGGGGGAVETVTGDGVDNTDPANPVISYPTPGDIGADLAGAAATAETNSKAYADGLVVGLWDDRGTFDASGGAYPSTGGSGTAGAIMKGDIWTISVAGTLPTGQVVEIGDTVRALVNTPGNTQANWAIGQNNIGYVAENAANKATSMTGNETSNILYLTAKAVYDWATGLFVQKNAGITGATKTKITYDTKGLVTSGADLSAGDIPDLDTSKITSGTMATARLGSGTADGTTFLSGDQSYKAPTGLTTFETNANALFRCDSPGGNSTFLGTIATLPGGATLTYNVTSGNEGAMVPQSTSLLGKMRIYNTTRGTSALISNCVTGTNSIILTANVPAGWQVGDTITITSTTVDGSAFSTYYVDIEITSGPTGKSGLFVNMGINGSAAAESLRLHPLETFALSKQVNLFANVAGVQSVRLGVVKITSNVFSVSWSGTPTVVQLFESGYIL